MVKEKSKREPALSERDAEEIALLCKALAHPARVRILKHLIDYGTCFFGDLSTVVRLAPSTISQHVTVLKEAGLINGSAEDQRVCYCAKPERVALLRARIGDL